MKDINWARFTLGALIVAAICFVSDGFLHQRVVKEQWQAVYDALGAAPPGHAGFMMIWLYAQPWFLDFSVFGVSMRELFQIRTYNLSVAVWVGFLALFGIATENGVIFCTYLDQVFKARNVQSVADIREATLEAGMKRIRPALMTAATTILALIPVLTSTGRGADVMVPMALPSFGGMSVGLITVFVVPTLYCLVKEVQFKAQSRKQGVSS